MNLALKIWNALMFMLCRLVYLFIKWLYQVFEAVSKANLFTEEVFDELTGRIYLIMGIAMLFIFAYNLVLMIINPDDKKGTGSMTKVVKETIISLVVVVLLPTIFNYMYTFQNHVVSSNILGQLILGGTGTGVQDPSECSDGDYECKCDFSFLSSGAEEIQTECLNYRNLTSSKRGANLVPVTIFSAFYRPANFTLNECANHLANNTDDITGDDHDICVNYYTGYQKAKYTGKINYLIDNDDLKDGIYEDPQLMEFDHIFALLAGLLGAWMFLCYAMEIGVRVFKLGVLQLISPIPVMMRVVPGQKEKMYDKWFKELLNTYLDVFIRLIIIFFALFAVSLVPEMIETLWSSVVVDSDSNAFVKLLAMVIVILGILKFAQEAPELIKTFFGNSGRFALKSPGKQIADNKLGGAALGMAGTGLASLAGNLWNTRKNFKEAEGFKNKAKALGKGSLSTIGGTFGGAFRGMTHGYGAKGFKDLGKRIAQAKEETDAAQNAGLKDRLKHRAKRIGAGFEDFGQFIAGTSASNTIGTAANNIMIDVDNMESDFSNAEIAGIKSGRDEIWKKFNSDQAFDYNGKHYTKVSPTEWNDGNENIKASQLRSQIVENYKDRLAMAYAANELKDGIIDGFKRANEGMLKDLRDALPKFGSEFSNNLFTNLNGLKDVNNKAMNLDVHSIDELEKRMGSMINKAVELSKSNDEKVVAQGKEMLASIYKINDEIKSAAKGKKLANDQALKAANKDKKDK